MVKLEINKYTKEATEEFNSLPNRAKEVVFSILDYIMDDSDKCSSYFLTLLLTNDCCQSPIEHILSKTLLFEEIFNLKDYEIKWMEVCSQNEIECSNGKTYRVDFLIYFSNKISDEKTVEYPLIIECDGYKYHKTKQQISNDNKRELALKKNGYDVLRFTGSQIYNEPFECARNIMEYASVKLKEKMNNG